MANLEVKFIGYVQYSPTHYHAEFVVRGDPRLPDGSQVNWDTLAKLGIKPAPFSFPSYWEWTRERFGRMNRNREFFKSL